MIDRPTTWTRVGSIVSIARGLGLALGAVALVLSVGFPEKHSALLPLADYFFCGLAALLWMLPWLEGRFTHWKSRDKIESVLQGIVLSITAIGVLTILLLPRETLETVFGEVARLAAISIWAKLAILVWIGLGLLSLFRRVSFSGWHPALVFVASFLVAVVLGMLLLMLPVARQGPDGADWLTALFTSTSAVCVTGLTVETTGTYWSREGQTIILCLIQLGGLGIMTFGAFFSLVVGRGLLVRESALLGDMLEQKMLVDVRRLVVTILLFTLISEAVGAALLSGLWSDLPFPEQLFFSVFHSVSAFCNAGFALTPDSFVGMGTRWQVWGGLCLLIIMGGLGFTVLDFGFRWFLYRLMNFANKFRRFRSRRRTPAVRLSVNTRLVWITTLLLLVGGTAAFALFESRTNTLEITWTQELAEAWFQSVTARTAGFNTVSIGGLSEATLLAMIVLMFIGASPGSTGGGVKTIPLAVSILSLRAVLRKRQRVEVFHRTIPETAVNRAHLILALGATIIVGMTLALVAIENKSGKFLDHLFEVCSAFATVGLSTGITHDLSRPGRMVIIVTMFIGRVGPLTLLVALSGSASPERFRYPDEQVILG